MDSSGGTLAYSYFPSNSDLAIDTDDLNGLLGNPTDGFLTLRNTIMHELGHGLGLEHTFSSNSDILMEESINTGFDGPQHDDLRGIHWMYGDAMEKGGRNETAVTASALGALTLGGGLQIGAGGSGTAIGASETDFVSIANENDDDYFSFTISEPVRIDATMTPRGASYLQDPTPFDTTTTNDLELALFDTNGVSLLEESDSGAAGVVESIDGLLLTTPGAYYARIQSTSSAVGRVVQFYQLDLAASSPVEGLLGDFDGNGTVDAIDYTIWRDTQGQSVSLFSGADHDGSGVIDQGDYDLWAANYGASGGQAVSVPEPGSVCIALATLVWARDRRRRYR